MVQVELEFRYGMSALFLLQTVVDYDIAGENMECRYYNNDIWVICSGGMELLFDNVRNVKVDIPAKDSLLTVRETMAWMRDNLLKERPEMFMKGDTIRHGVLVLVNDADWELSGLEDSEVENGDKVTFISTLHGG